MKLRIPIDEALRTFRERQKALAYQTAGIAPAAVAAAAQKPNAIGLRVEVIAGRGIRALRPNAQPSCYVAYVADLCSIVFVHVLPLAFLIRVSPSSLCLSGWDGSSGRLRRSEAPRCRCLSWPNNACV
jgi:hypothetical protein